jgi:type II secretory pathway pseudopilin PulG
MKILNKSYKAFTLVEMLIVMGILIILMTMGIAAGRFAIQRANQIQHQSASDQLFQGLQSYYADNREYPSDTDFTSFGTALSASGVLGQYIDTQSFDGGSDATYYYFVDTDTQQSVIICVTLGGHDDDNEFGVYCNGNGFGELPDGATNPVSTKDIETTSAEYTTVINASGNGVVSTDWDATTKNWQ